MRPACVSRGIPLVIIVSRAHDDVNSITPIQCIPICNIVLKIKDGRPMMHALQGCVFWADFLDLQDEVWHHMTILLYYLRR